MQLWLFSCVLSVFVHGVRGGIEMYSHDFRVNFQSVGGGGGGDTQIQKIESIGLFFLGFDRASSS